MESLLQQIRTCTLCAEHLPLGPRPVVSASLRSKILLVGQAPGKRVHASGIPWDDASGNRLRSWLDVSYEQFYNPDLFALVPMGFCYPGTGKSGDAPPRPECSETWHEPLLAQMPDIQLVLLFGTYAQRRYLPQVQTIAEAAQHWMRTRTGPLPMPHPSPRNNLWLSKNPWFENSMIPMLRAKVQTVLAR